MPNQELADWGLVDWADWRSTQIVLRPRYCAVEDYEDHVRRIVRRAEWAAREARTRLDADQVRAGYCRVPARQWALGEDPSRPSMDGLLRYAEKACQGTGWSRLDQPASPYSPGPGEWSRIIRGYFAARSAGAVFWRRRMYVRRLGLRPGWGGPDGVCYATTRGLRLLCRVSRAAARAVMARLLQDQARITLRTVRAELIEYCHWAAAGGRAAAERAGVPARFWRTERGRAFEAVGHVTLGRRMPVIAYDDGTIAVGCRRHTVDVWREEWREIAAKHGVEVHAAAVTCWLAVAQWFYAPPPAGDR